MRTRREEGGIACHHLTFDDILLHSFNHTLVLLMLLPGQETTSVKLLELLLQVLPAMSHAL